MIREIVGVGGIAHLIINHFQLALLRAVFPDGLNKVAAHIPIQPGCPHHKGTGTDLPDILLSQPFGFSVDAAGGADVPLGIGDDRVVAGAGAVAVKHIVGGHIHQFGPDFLGGGGQKSWRYGVDLHGCVRRGFAAVNIGHGGAVDNKFRFFRLDKSLNGSAVGDIQAIHVHRRHPAAPIGGRNGTDFRLAGGQHGGQFVA